jgi:hypothetical protein
MMTTSFDDEKMLRSVIAVFERRGPGKQGGSNRRYFVPSRKATVKYRQQPHLSSAFMNCIDRGVPSFYTLTKYNAATGI